MKDEILGEWVASSRGKRNPRTVKQVKTKYRLRQGARQATEKIDFEEALRIGLHLLK